MVGSVRMNSATQGTVSEQVEGGQNLEFLVDLERRHCSCGRFQDTLVPCGHACAIIFRLEQALYDFLPFYSNFAALHIRNLGVTPIAIGEDGQVDQEMLEIYEEEAELEEVEPPMTSVAAGRPKKLRFRVGANRARTTTGRAAPKCSKCGRPGHYAPRCRYAHT